MPRILVTPRSVTTHGHRALKRLEVAGFDVVLGPRGRQPTEDELLQLLPGCVGYLAGVEPVSARVITSACSTLRIISRNGTGTDAIDIESATANGVAVSSAAGANARGVAELTLALLLALARGVSASDATLKAGLWERVAGFELEGRTLGVLGFGQVGRRVAELALGFGMKIRVYDPLISVSPQSPDNADAARRMEGGGGAGEPVTFETLETVFVQADILTLHCPPSTNGETLIDAEAIKKMKRGVYIINTARFELFDEAAMLRALETGHVGGLALDVFREEPPRDSVLVRHPKVIATPHIGGFTAESIDRAMEAAVDNLLAVLARR